MTYKYEVPEEPEIEVWSVNTAKSSCTKIREEKLMEQRQNHPEAYAVLYNECPKCQKSFRTKRDTKRHAKACRRDGANRVQIKFGGTYPCQICHQTNDTLKVFKLHIFYKHHEDQVQ